VKDEKRIRVAYITNILPNYRKGFYEKLFKSEEISLDVYAQTEAYDMKSALNDAFPANVITIRHTDFFNARLTWQKLPWTKLYKEYDVLKIDGNPRIITHFLIAGIFRLLGKKVILYSMLHSYKNNKFNEVLRIIWMRFFQYHLLHNEEEIKSLKANGFANKTMVAYNNGIDQKIIEAQKVIWTKEKLEDWKKEHKIEDKIDVLTCGRATIGKYEILLDAIALLHATNFKISCHIIGSGDGIEILKAKIEKLGLQANIKLEGEIYEEEKLAPFFINSKIFVYPFAIGLSINHAFGYGLPIITHDNPSEHGPEIILFQEGTNGLSYKQNNAEDLANKIRELLKNEEKIHDLSKNAYDLVSRKFNVDNMADSFVGLVKTAYFDK
jgi:glycosyltransferase involved in cell wall biosynthesis